MIPYIASTGAYVPAKIVTNHDLATTLDTSDEWIYSHTGIKTRRIAAAHEASSDLGLIAAKQALSRARLAPEDVDLIIVATSTPDFTSFPSTASIIQEKLGAVRSGAMDLSAACTGFVYALETARAFVSAGTAQNVIVIGTEVFSRILDWNDRNSAILFGDGAGAVVITSAAPNSPSSILGSVLRSEGSGADSLLRPVGGSRTPYVINSPLEATHLQMDGRRVYNFAVRAIKEVLEEASSKFHFDLNEVKWFVPHQANSRIIEATAKRMGIPIERFFMNIAKFANTSAASIPIALEELEHSGGVARGDLIVFVGFGAGLAYGASVLRW